MQFIILVIGMPILVFYGISAAGGIGNVFANVPKNYFNVLNNTNIYSFLSLFCTLIIGEMLVPPYVQRLLIGRNAKDTSSATISSGYVSVIFFVLTGIVGLIGYTIDSSMQAETVMISLIQKVLPVGISGLIISAMMAIVLSTADSFLNSAAVSVINDVYLPLKENRVGEKERLKIVRIANVVIGIVAVTVALTVPRLLDILTLSYSFWAPTILPILLFTILGYILKEKAVWSGIISGMFGCIIWNTLLQKPYRIDGLIIGFVLNLIVTVIMQLIGKVVVIKVK